MGKTERQSGENETIQTWIGFSRILTLDRVGCCIESLEIIMLNQGKLVMKYIGSGSKTSFISTACVCDLESGLFPL